MSAGTVLPESNVYIGLTNPKSPSNVGAVMRAAGCFSVDAVHYTGQRYARAAKFNTDTKAIASKIPLRAVNELHQPLPAGMKVVCIELVEGATPLPAFQHPEQAIYIFGSEDGSISQELINIADEVVYIPTIGCLNLAATVNVVLYDRLSKAKNTIYGDELIVQSRDTNNKLKRIKA